ncbi:MAG: ABC transporter permease [Anaerolineae bacterium]|mgnify:CR=1 FL=1|jgi:ABC-2 type transport system permease protein|nr:ABC transporter permease [Anaerolineae bacterium]MBT4309874.1 ABC transporter permease [Anaerolineae bacterium]MBT4457511.1 ABC transporter permease [Anaerolineae bacterium]MBT4843624.1 ABC transporter permease [Anaerolineae bacterium]MBT6060780.1 ABC transporter permease [Anaerolineae bacterium]
MKILDIALKDMLRSFRSFFAVVFMFIVPLLVTGMFYFMFGNIADGGEFNLPRTKVIIANLDEGGPKFQVDTDNIPGGESADSMGDLIVSIMESEEMSALIAPTYAESAEIARKAVDSQDAQVAIIIPADFSDEFADIYGKAAIEFYQDPTLTLGPGIMRSIMNRFMDGMSGVKIALTLFLEDAPPEDAALVGQVVQQYLHLSLAQEDDIETELLDVRTPTNAQENKAEQSENLLLSIISPIMGGMMVFYAFFTGSSTAQSILKEEEEFTLQRIFTTPTSQTTILGGKLLAVFMTVSVQVTVLLIAARLLFNIEWGALPSVILAALGIIFSASSFGIFLNSFLKDSKQGGVLFGGLLTITGMIGMIGALAGDSPVARKLSNSVSLFVPQGWALRGLTQAMSGAEISALLITALVLLAWSTAFFAIGTWRFTKRFA